MLQSNGIKKHSRLVTYVNLFFNEMIILLVIQALSQSC